MQKIAVVNFPRITIENIDSFRKKYDTNSQIIPIHMTLIQPMPEDLEAGVIEQVKEVSKDFKPFLVQLKGVRKTHDNCIFLEIKNGKERLMVFQNELFSKIHRAGRQKDNKFYPHITICDLTKPDEKLINLAFEEAQNLDFDLTYIFDSISLIKGDGHCKAVTIMDVNLGTRIKI
jgi:2'-5' RNA ligase